jgi:hypothetical protein
MVWWVSPRWIRYFLVAVLAAGAFALGRQGRPEPLFPPPPAAASDGVECLKDGGDHDYCMCLDRFGEARAITGQHAAPPALNDPALRYAMTHMRQYPVINGDTLRCLRPPGAPGPGDLS